MYVIFHCIIYFTLLHMKPQLYTAGELPSWRYRKQKLWKQSKLVKNLDNGAELGSVCSVFLPAV